MTFQNASTVSLICFLILVAVIIAGFIYGSYKGDSASAKRTAIFLVVWNLISSELVISGIIEQKFMRQNFDIITGILAVGVLIPALRKIEYIWMVNVVGI